MEENLKEKIQLLFGTRNREMVRLAQKICHKEKINYYVVGWTTEKLTHIPRSMCLVHGWYSLKHPGDVGMWMRVYEIKLNKNEKRKSQR